MSYFSIAFLIGFLTLDTTIAFQILLAQPIFSCSIIGFVLGDVMAGAEIGAMMQLLWLNVVPTGGIRAPEGNLASMLVCTIVLLFAALLPPNVLLTSAFLLGLLVSAVAKFITALRRRLNGWIYQQVLQAVEDINVRKISWLQWGAPAFYLLAISAFVLLVLIAFDAAIPVIAENFRQFEHQLFWIKPMIWATGFGLLADLLWKNFRNRG